MPKLRLYYPAKPFVLTQGWGILNPIYNQFGFSRHNGVDFRLGDDGMIRAPFDGVIVRTGNQPNGGGIFLGLISQEKFLFEDGKICNVLLDLLHLDHVLVSEGAVVKTGDVLAKADNTGLSTGPHTHMQPRRALGWNGEAGDQLAWIPADLNDANNTFDPQPYWTGIHAQDVQKTIGRLQAIIPLLKSLVELLLSRKNK